MHRRDSTWPGGGGDGDDDDDDNNDDAYISLCSRHYVKCSARVTSLTLENSPKRMEYHHHFIVENTEVQVIR